MRRNPAHVLAPLSLLAALLASSTSLLALAPSDRFDPRPPSRPARLLPAALLPGERPTSPSSVTGAPAAAHDDAAAVDGGPRQSLLRAATQLGNETYIPYVWGGDAISDPATCEACRSCVAGKHRLSVERRAGACSACRLCGVDCSHFVNRVFRLAGLPYPYLTTAALKRLPASRLRRDYGLVDLGRDLRRALPGDLLVTKHHVVLLLGMRGGSVGDFVHVSRSIKHGRIGGVEVVRAKDILRYRGRLARILRHQALDDDQNKAGEATPARAPLPQAPSMALSGQRFVRLLP